MIKVITYGTFDLLHEGHINILKRAKALGDYLIVGVTTENFDVTRGKINVRQSLIERMDAVRRTGIADEVIPEEYVGQKIDDIQRNGVDIFAIGSDWVGKFDYLKEYCKVVYLPRTEGISSSQLRSSVEIKLGVVGIDPTAVKLCKQSEYVNGVTVSGAYFDEPSTHGNLQKFDKIYKSYEELLNDNNAVYVATRPEERYRKIKLALEAGKHVISESPIALKGDLAEELYTLAESKGLQLFDSIKTAYSLSFSRLVVLIKSGIIGEVKNIDVTCTSLEVQDWLKATKYYTSFTGWGAVALLPILKILGTDYENVSFLTLDSSDMKDIFTKATLSYSGAVATLNVGTGVKSEGDMRISGTKGYIYVPAPWWMTDKFEVRFEDSAKRIPHFYENEGEGLRMELVQFVRSVNGLEANFYMGKEFTVAISKIMELYAERRT